MKAKWNQLTTSQHMECVDFTAASCYYLEYYCHYGCYRYYYLYSVIFAFDYQLAEVMVAVNNHRPRHRSRLDLGNMNVAPEIEVD